MGKRVVLVTCVDPRLHEASEYGDSFMSYFIKLHDISPFLVTRAGGIQDLIRPLKPGFDESMIRDVKEVGIEHGGSEVILLNHTDCRAYDNLRLDERAEHTQHFKDLLSAKSIISSVFRIDIHLFLAEKGRDGAFMARYLRPGRDY